MTADPVPHRRPRPRITPLRRARGYALQLAELFGQLPGNPKLEKKASRLLDLLNKRLAEALAEKRSRGKHP